MTFKTVSSFIEYMKYQVHRKVFIWGTGVCGESMGRFLNKIEIAWEGYYDNYYHNISSLNEKPIFWGETAEIDISAVYIVAIADYDVVKRQITGCGVPEDNIIWFENLDFWDELGERLAGNVNCANAIKEFHNIHYGKKCFVIGNGPSLTLADLEKIRENGICSFASNSIFNCFSKTLWRPDYYFVVDGWFIINTFKDNEQLAYILGNCKYMFTRSNSWLCHFQNDPNIKNLFLFQTEFQRSLSVYEFSEDCSQKVFSGYTVTYAMLQMAAYMGFSEIYLLGIDHHYSNEMTEDGGIAVDANLKDHAEMLHDSFHVNAAPVYKMTRAYEAAKRYAEAHGIRICNATRGGALEVFERVDFDSLFAS